MYYKFKFLTKSDHKPLKSPPYKTQLLRLWIVNIAWILLIAGIIETMYLPFRFTKSAVILIIAFTCVLYVVDVFAESYKFFRHAFAPIATIISLAYLALAVKFQSLMFVLFFIYGLVSVYIAFKEYDL